jgi:hypothetical protein
MTLPVDDVVAIQQLYATYNHLIDGGQGAPWADLFVEDGTLDTGLGFAVDGTTAARAEFGDNVPVIMPGSRHVVSNLRIDGDGDAATGAAYLQLWVTDDDGTGLKLLVSGIYQDRLRKVEDGWRFVTRTLVPDAGGPVP